ncbi:hypothetical protein [Alteribacillus iranensis]|uniref:Uncharacterized protein n=1 Tax=Alteribacillus iranensis TaxID=930128 RepID=A0A1I2BYK1_9BACI|nr:hypothetical protein [Alteribacillus iranensis]SFE61045.1 hypothetical protein SAMN05192532_102576 [Alteribacillus iranensis]
MNRCKQCHHTNLLMVSSLRYVFFMSVFPVVIAMAIGLLAEKIFFLFIPAIILTNIVLAKKKAPIILCKDCRHVETPQTRPAKETV